MLEEQTPQEQLQEMIHFEAGRYAKAVIREERAWSNVRAAVLNRQTCVTNLRLLKAELRRVANDDQSTQA